MKYLFFVLFFLILCLKCSAQYEWLNTYSYSLDNFITSVDTTSDQGYFLAGGYQDQSSAGNYFAAKLDSNGNEIWHIIGDKYNAGTGNNSAKCILNTGDGGCLVGGIIQSNNNGTDLYFIRIDSTGHVVWEKTLGGINDQYPCSILRKGNNYLCSFKSFPNPYFNAILELNDQGDSLWSKNLYFEVSYFPSSLIRSYNSNIVICGTLISLVDSNQYDLAYSEFDSTGNNLKTIRFSDTLDFYARTINQMLDGGFLISSYDYFDKISKIIKTDSTGIIQWVKKFNNANNCVATVLTNNDIVVSLGSNDYSINILEFDVQGNIKNSDTISIGFIQASVMDNITDRNGSLLLCGEIYNSNSCQGCSSQGMVLKKNLDNTNSINDLLIMDISKIIIYPNPLNISFSDLTIESKKQLNKFTILDLTGSIIFQSDKNISTKDNRFQLHLRSQLSAGTYFILFESISGNKDCMKLIVIN